MQVQAAVVQHALDVGQLFKDNMAIKHGLPQRGPIAVDPPEPPGPLQPITVRLETSQPLATATATAPTQNNPPAASPAGSLLKQTWPILLAAALGSTGAGGLTYWLTRGGDQPATTIINQGETSLLQHLQEQGFHLPAGEKP